MSGGCEGLDQNLKKKPSSMCQFYIDIVFCLERKLDKCNGFLKQKNDCYKVNTSIVLKEIYSPSFVVYVPQFFKATHFYTSLKKYLLHEIKYIIIVSS